MPIQRPKSIAEQVKGLLQQRIRDSVYPPGSRMPSESDLASELGVSRATLRTVLARLATEGLILRKQGDGTYVNERIRDIDNRYGGVWDFSRLIAANGFEAAIRTDSMVERPATRREAAALGLAAEEPVLALLRTFEADGEPVIVTTNVLPAALLRGDVDPADGRLPIHQFMHRYCQEQIVYAVTDIEAVPAEERFAAMFARPITQPLLKLIETFYSRNNEPLVSGLSYYDQTRLRLRLVQPWG